MILELGDRSIFDPRRIQRCFFMHITGRPVIDLYINVHTVRGLTLMDEKKRIIDAELDHRLNLSNREKLSLDGVRGVGSFDDQEVVVETCAGGLVVRGRDLHITQLNLDQGQLALEGYIRTLEYLDDGLGKKGRGMFGKLLR